METIKFDANGHNAPAYGCNKPGDNSGEYVPAALARELYEALEELVEAFEHSGCGPSASDIDAAIAALAKARGE